MKFKSDFLQEINSRGFIYQSSDLENLDKLMTKEKITAWRTYVSSCLEKRGG